MIFSVIILLFLICERISSTDPLAGGAIIGNDKVVLGVSKFGSLNVYYREVSDPSAAFSLPASDPTGINRIALRTTANNLFNSIEAGCACEGWGVRVHNIFTGVTGALGKFNLNLVSFTGTDGGLTAKSEVMEGTSSSFSVTHDFYPSPNSPYVFECDVTIKNLLTTDSASVQYRRVIDWDMWPSNFHEYVSIWGTQTTSTLLHSNDNGFCGPDPQSSCPPRHAGTTDQDFEDVGPMDHGAQFTLEFGILPALESITFKIFFGATDGELKAITALSLVHSELHTLAQQENGAATGLPFTAFFGFKDVSGVCFKPCPDCFEETDCVAGIYGDHPSCHGCNVYASCTTAGDLVDDRPCPSNLVWHDAMKRCDWDSHCNFGWCSTAVDHTPNPCGFCVSNCAGIVNGDYKSCQGDNVYASCVAREIIDNRPCPAGLVWDDMLKICNWESSCSNE